MADCMKCVNRDNDFCLYGCDNGESFKPITNADRIRAMTDEELANFMTRQRFSVVNLIADRLGINVTSQFLEGRKNLLDWLKQEVDDG